MLARRPLILLTLLWFLINLNFTFTAVADDLTELSLENLMDVEITSVSKKKTKVSNAAAAIFVLTQEDIRRSGATSVPELLRQVPGINVAQAGANTWAVSSRGFNDVFAQKLLVLIDGRSVYTPLFSGVFWDEQTPVLADIERIEVIRGPGASLWGANAVSGVINIITKNANQTQGVLVDSRVGNEDQVGTDVRYGFKTGENTATRVYSSYAKYDGFVEDPTTLEDDGWQNLRGGFRTDSKISKADTLTLLGNLNYNSLGTLYLAPTLTEPFADQNHYTADNFNFNALSRWEHAREDDSSSIAQLYFDRDQREGPTGNLLVNTVDADVQNTSRINKWLDLIYGANWRLVNDELDPYSETVSFSNPSRSTTLLSTFLQSDIHLIPDSLTLIVGSKVEHNDYSGFEIQPNARLVWTPDIRNTFWGSIARAARTPSRSDENLRLSQTLDTYIDPNTGLPVVTSVSGNNDFNSEDVLALELGYRTELTRSVSIDIATFYNIYEDLRSIEPSPVQQQFAPVPYLQLPVQFDNQLRGNVYGAELAVSWAVTDWSKFTAAYSYLQMDLNAGSESAHLLGTDDEGNSPNDQLSLRYLMDIAEDWEFDTYLYYVDSLPNQSVPSYVRIDTRLGWHITQALEASFVIQNLFDDKHSEFGTPNAIGVVGGPVERSFYGRLTWHLDK